MKKAKQLSFKRFIKVSEQGEVLEDRTTKIRPPGDWIEIPREETHMLGMDTHRLRYCSVNGLIEKPEIRLSVGGYTFPADNKTAVAIGLRGDNLPAGESVDLTINGEQYSVKKHEDLMLTSADTGTFYVRVTDPHYCAIPAEASILCVEPSHETD